MQRRRPSKPPLRGRGMDIVDHQVAARPEILTPEPEGTLHGQMLLDMPGIFFNFTDESVDDCARRLARFLTKPPTEEQLAAEPLLELFPFFSPHDLEGRTYYLTRHGAERVMAVCHARSAGPGVIPRSRNSQLVQVSGEELRALGLAK